MTPKEKAKELVLKFAFKGAQHEGEAKSFALIAVDEIINESPSKIYWQTYDDETPSTTDNVLIQCAITFSSLLQLQN
jgi:hypothetical protein